METLPVGRQGTSTSKPPLPADTTFGFCDVKVSVDYIRTPADADQVEGIFRQRPGSEPPAEMIGLTQTYVARSTDDDRVVAVAMVRFGRPTVVDSLEAERVDGRATKAGTAGMWALGKWIEEYVAQGGGGRVVAMVAADNEEHKAALTKVGYSPRCIAFAKDVGD